MKQQRYYLQHNATLPRTRRRAVHSSPPRKHFRQLIIEGLEDRRLLTVDIPPLLDINLFGTSSQPTNLVEVGGTLYFAAFDGVNGRELWKSDGTQAGTVMVKDIRPGSLSSSPDKLTNVGGTLYFTANDGTSGTELWKSDGTEAGTVLVKDITPGSGSYSPPTNLINVGGILYFTASDGVNGRELWKSDGTEAGTVMVRTFGLAPWAQIPPI